MSLVARSGLSIEAVLVRGGPVPWAYIPLETGLTAMYGLNGAGKTFILESIRSCLSGIKPQRVVGQPALVVQLAEDAVRFEEAYGFYRLTYAAEKILQGFSRPSHEITDLAYFDLPEYLRERVLESLLTYHDKWEMEVADFPLDELAREVVDHRFFVLEPTGSSEPMWRIRPAITVSHATPVAASWINMIREQKFYDLEASIDDVMTWLPLEDVWPEDTQRLPYSPDRPMILTVQRDTAWEQSRLWFDVIEPDDGDPNTATNKALREAVSGWADPPVPAFDRARALLRAQLEIVDEGDGGNLAPHLVAHDVDTDDLVPGPLVSGLAAALEQDANLILSDLLADAPVLHLRVRGVSAWITDPATEWVAMVGATGTPFPLSQLSRAQQRWANVAITTALTAHRQPVMLLDEPEAALHRSAEVKLVRSLERIADQYGLPIYCATHSPEMLDMPSTRLLLVRRQDLGTIGGSHVHGLLSPTRGELEAFGLLPSDLLRRQRGFLIVEGEHELVILDELVGDDLRRLRIEVLPLRGASQLKAVLDSRVLYDFTDAHLFIMLDALDARRIQQAWDRARQDAKTHPMGTVIEALALSIKDPLVNESGIMAGFLTRALQRDLGDRITPLPLLRSDVLEYLPAGGIVERAESWSQLKADYLTSTNSQTLSGTKFKEWLREAKKARLQPEQIRQVAHDMHAIPAEIRRCVGTIEEVLTAR